MTRTVAFRSYVLAFAATAGVVAVAACSSPAPLGGQGASCSTPDDCAANLDCVQQVDGTRICSSDLGPIVHTEEAGYDTGTTMMMGDGAPGDGGTKPPGDSGAPPKDTGSPPIDSTMPPQDTGSPPQDTGSPPKDTGSPPQDTGTSSGG